MEGARKVGTEFALLALILVTGLISTRPLVLLLALPIAAHLTLGLALASAHRDLRAQRSLSAHRIHEGGTVQVDIAAEKSGSAPELVMVSDDRSLARYVTEGSTSLIDFAPRTGSMMFSYLSQPVRGFYPLDGAHLSVRDVLGFATWEGDVPCPTPLWVLPRYSRTGQIKVSPRRTLPRPGTAPSRRDGVGVQFLGTRPYIPGDDLRRVNWKTLAHRDQLVINLYEGERAAEVTVVLDGRDRVYHEIGGRDLFEQAVRACASLCDSAIGDGHRTALLLYGERLEWVVYGSGRRHLEGILQGLARAKLGYSEAFADLGNLPARLFPSGSSVIIVSPFAPGDEQALGMLRARGYDVLALVPDPFPPARTEQPAAAWHEGRTNYSVQTKTPLWLASRFMAIERELLLRVLMSAGVRVALWDVNNALAPLLKSAWGRRR
jgi:uncharacterized protein (DUF58 family)